MALPKLSELAAKIVEKTATVPAPAPVKAKKATLKRLGERARVEAPPPPPAPSPAPEKPKIDLTGKSTWEIMLEMGDVPHYMVSRKPEWEVAPEKEIVEEIGGLKPTYLLRLSEYYNRLDKMKALSEKEKFAAQAMRDRIWNENIGEVSVDLVPLIPEDREQIEKLTITTLAGEQMSAVYASNRELAEHIYLKSGGPVVFGKLRGSPFDPEAEVKSEFADVIKPKFEPSGPLYGNRDAPLQAVQTQLAREALYKRLLFGRAQVPVQELKVRQGRAAEWKAVAEAYYPPEYEEVKGYYRPDWKSPESLTYVQQEMIKLPPADLLKTYKIYFIMKSKGQLDKSEEQLLDEMERILDGFQERGLLAVERPKTVPPLPISQEGFNDYLKLVNEMFGTLPEEAVVKLSKKPESDVVLKVLRSGTAGEDERKVFVRTIDELFEALPTEEMDKFSAGPKANLYMRVVDKYGAG